MYASINGIYENGNCVLSEIPPTKKKTKIVVTFLEEIEVIYRPKRRLGGLEGMISIPDNFNEPLDDLKEYM